MRLTLCRFQAIARRIIAPQFTVSVAIHHESLPFDEATYKTLSIYVWNSRGRLLCHFSDTTLLAVLTKIIENKEFTNAEGKEYYDNFVPLTRNKQKREGKQSSR